MDYIFNDEQINCICKIKNFISKGEYYSRALVNGSAGSGKTTLIIYSAVTSIINMASEIYSEISIPSKDDLKDVYNFIVAAPTNKARDVLISKKNSELEKYNKFINKLDLCNESKKEIKQLINKNIVFLTVSQLLGVNKVVNELGDEEFTKGNPDKIQDKYNDTKYDNTILIIDECSMIDDNNFELLSSIRCPLIYIGDDCQLPPIKQDISKTFENNEKFLTLKLSKVERCKNAITNVANILREKIHSKIPKFSLLEHQLEEIKIYKNDYNKWLKSYVNSVQHSQNIIKELIENITLRIEDKSFDTMALAWTNRCVENLNMELRNLLFIEDENIDLDNEHIIKGEKLLIKNCYYKYGYKLFSSSLSFVSKLQQTKYKPISFKNWLILLDNINKKELEALTTTSESGNNDSTDSPDSKSIKPEKKSKAKNTNKTTSTSTTSTKSPSINFDIDISTVLNISDNNHDDETNTLSKHKKRRGRKPKNITDYFAEAMISNEEEDSKESQNEPRQQQDLEVKEFLDKEKKRIEDFRLSFFQYHNIPDIANRDAELSEFNDEITKYYSHYADITQLKSVKCSTYYNWHKRVGIDLFGIPVESVYCKKCKFLMKKFKNEIIERSELINEMIRLTENMELDIYLVDLITVAITENKLYCDIPIINNFSKNNDKKIRELRDIIKKSFQIKVNLTAKDEMEFNNINKVMGEEEITNNEVNTNDVETDPDNKKKEKPMRKLPLSLFMGHYLSHVFSSSLLEVDYGYALTVHKSQGSTYYDVYLEYTDLMKNVNKKELEKLLFTGITRCSNHLYVYNY